MAARRFDDVARLGPPQERRVGITGAAVKGNPGVGRVRMDNIDQRLEEQEVLVVLAYARAEHHDIEVFGAKPRL